MHLIDFSLRPLGKLLDGTEEAALLLYFRFVTGGEAASRRQPEKLNGKSRFVSVVGKVGSLNFPFLR
jgi:hypothetical protein